MIVIDTSVIVKLIVPEPRSDKAASLRTNVLAAPSLWQAEIGNTLWRKVVVGEIPATRSTPLLRSLFGGVIVTLDIDERATREALDIAIALEHPIYDCFFLEAAIHHDTFVVTDDTRFAFAVRSHKKWVRHLRLLSEF